MLDAEHFLTTIGVFSYNQGPFIKECIDSLIDEKLTKVILVDDGSTDESQDELRMAAMRLQDAGHEVEVHLHTVNRGLAQRVNTFLGRIDTEFFCLVNADDRFHPGGLNLLRNLATSHPSASVIFSAYDQIDVDGKRLPEAGRPSIVPQVCSKYEAQPQPAYEDLLCFGNFVSGGCTLVRSEIVDRMNARFDPQLQIAEDYDFWLQLGPQCLYLFEKTATWDYRIVPTSRYQSTGPRGLLYELMVIARHQIGSPWRIRVCSNVQAAHRAKRQWLKLNDKNRIGFRQTASIMNTPILLFSVAAIVAGLQTITRMICQKLGVVDAS